MYYLRTQTWTWTSLNVNRTLLKSKKIVRNLEIYLYILYCLVKSDIFITYKQLFRHEQIIFFDGLIFTVKLMTFYVQKHLQWKQGNILHLVVHIILLINKFNVKPKESQLPQLTWPSPSILMPWYFKSMNLLRLIHCVPEVEELSPQI